MFLIDSRDTRLADEQDQLKKDAWPHRKRRSLVAWLRRHACRCHIETAPQAHRGA